MEWKITFASDFEDRKAYTMNINTLEELKKLSQKYNNERLIVNFVNNTIIVYDYYVE